MLLEEVTYPVLMHHIIDDRSRKGDQRIDQLFVPHKETGSYQKPMEMKKSQALATTSSSAGPSNGMAPINVRTTADAQTVVETPAAADITPVADTLATDDGPLVSDSQATPDDLSTANGPTSTVSITPHLIGTISNGVLVGKIQALREGFGFITPNDGSGNLFFFHASVLNADFNELRVGDEVTYKIGNNDKGICAVDVEIMV